MFDEVEKAHPDVFNVLLQVLDDGRLTDGQGRVVDFKNTIIIMTSNLGSELILSQDENALKNEKVSDEIKEKIDGLLKTKFRPEFLNRIDEIVMFNRLGKDAVGNIVKIQLEKLKKRLEDRRIKLAYSDDAVSRLVQYGYKPDVGARPIKRAVQNYVENPLAKSILEGKFMENSTVYISTDQNGLVFSSEK